MGGWMFTITIIINLICFFDNLIDLTNWEWEHVVKVVEVKEAARRLQEKWFKRLLWHFYQLLIINGIWNYYKEWDVFKIDWRREERQT